ncbi:MAG: anaerobic sulfatase maturase [Eubacteriales bacterium]|nr:anaerobic sulfatase maturase [Eubacteriales bacterium]
MPPLSLLIKPASSACNMRCRYCFYADEAMNRTVYSFGQMSEETLENVLRKAFAYAEGALHIGFQGGEPTLRGLDFFRTCARLCRELNQKGLRVSLALQTNGLLLDEEWAKFLHEERFLVGLSLDGTQALHDRLRPDAAGQGTFSRVLAAAELLRGHRVDFNVLTVVTSYAAKNIGRIYAFFRKNGLLYQQYIPCLDPLGEPRGLSEYSLTPPLYARFMKDLFDLWYDDVAHGRFIYVRHLENLLAAAAGRPPEHCGMLGRCAMQGVVEADGSVYPCDFYVLDRYRLGNLNECDFPELMRALQQSGFIEESLLPAEECRRCEWAALCRGGCRRDRDAGDHLALNYFCPAYRSFYPYALPKLQALLRRAR